MPETLLLWLRKMEIVFHSFLKYKLLKFLGYNPRADKGFDQSMAKEAQEIFTFQSQQ